MVLLHMPQAEAAESQFGAPSYSSGVIHLWCMIVKADCLCMHKCRSMNPWTFRMWTECGLQSRWQS